MNLWIEITRTVSAIIAGAAGGFGYSVWLKHELDEVARYDKERKMGKHPKRPTLRRFAGARHWVARHWMKIVMLIVAACVVTSAVLEIRSNSKAERADKNAAKVAKAYKAQNDCLFNIVNQMADALDARTSDASRYRKADAKQDDVVVRLFEVQDRPLSEIKKVQQEYLQATLDKKAALAAINKGIREKTYPNPPREACADVVE